MDHNIGYNQPEVTRNMWCHSRSAEDSGCTFLPVGKTQCPRTYDSLNYLNNFTTAPECCVSKATDTHLEYVTLFAFTRQQWFREASQCYFFFLRALSYLTLQRRSLLPNCLPSYGTRKNAILFPLIKKYRLPHAELHETHEEFLSTLWADLLYTEY